MPVPKRMPQGGSSRAPKPEESFENVESKNSSSDISNKNSDEGFVNPYDGEESPFEEESFAFEDDAEDDNDIFSEEDSEKPNKNKDIDVSYKDQPSFIDEDNLRLESFGDKGGKKRRKDRKNRQIVRTGDFDNRTNIKRQQKLIKVAALSGIGLLVGLSIFQTIVPEDKWTEEEISTIAQQSSGVTDFPLERGSGFAKDFVESYLTIGGEDEATVQSALNYFYTGSPINSSGSSTSSGVTNDIRTASGNTQQKLIFGPTVYDQMSVTNNSGNYTIGAMVQQTDESEDDEVAKDMEEDPESYGPTWVFFNVSVFYDSEEDSFAIAEGSPTVVPSENIKPRNTMPDTLALGEDGTDSPEIEEQITNLINGFMTNYALSTPSDYSGLEQYIVSDPGPDLRDGFNGEYALVSSPEFKAYPMDEEGNVVQVRVEVAWKDTPKGIEDPEDDLQNASVQYPSTYILELQKQPDNRYLVSKMNPEIYIPDFTSLE